MESWRKVFRQGVVPCLTSKQLEVLLTGLIGDDKRLLQGATTTPPPLQCVQEWEVEGACLLGYCGWIGEGLKTVGDVEEFFAHLCFKIDQHMGEPAACRWLLNWYDDCPRNEMRMELVKEVNLALKIKQGELNNEVEKIREVV